jgi:signal transduction histidine kinase
LANLLANAAKFTPRGGHTWLSLEGKGSEAVIRVRDNGVGIKPDLMSRLFEPFVQAEQPLHRSKGGLGLGLPRVKELVRLHGGTVEARSEGVGRGAEVVVSLPLWERRDSRGEHAAHA